MAVNQPPMFVEEGCYVADDFRGIIGAFSGGREGVFRGMAPTVTAGTRTITIGAGEAVVSSEQAGRGSYLVKLPSPVSLTAQPGAASGGTRIDLIVARVQAVAEGDSQDVASVEFVQGVAGAGAPAMPARTSLVATVTVAQGATTLVQADVKGAMPVSKRAGDPCGFSYYNDTPYSLDRLIWGVLPVLQGTGPKMQRDVGGWFTGTNGVKVPASQPAHPNGSLYRVTASWKWSAPATQANMYHAIHIGANGAYITDVGLTQNIPIGAAAWGTFTGTLQLGAGDEVFLKAYQGSSGWMTTELYRFAIEEIGPNGIRS